MKNKFEEYKYEHKARCVFKTNKKERLQILAIFTNMIITILKK